MSAASVEIPKASIRNKQSRRSIVFTIVIVSAGFYYFLSTKGLRVPATHNITLPESVANKDKASSPITNADTSPKINFVHIPKSGGTTFEILSQMNNHSCGLWGSQMVGNQTLKKQYPWGSGFWHATSESNKITTPCTCAEWHMPPSLLPKNRLERLYPASETFCVLRKPLDRLISFYYYHFTGPGKIHDGRIKYVRGNPCYNNSATDMNKILRINLGRALKRPCWFACHLLPQTWFMEGFGDNDTTTNNSDMKNDASSRDCDHVLILDRNLSTQFNNLMDSVNCPIRFPEGSRAVNANSASRHLCKSDPRLYFNHNLHMLGKQWTPFTVADLEDDVVALARELYNEDIHLYDQIVATMA
jgi:hypothetical protein